MSLVSGHYNHPDCRAVMFHLFGKFNAVAISEFHIGYKHVDALRTIPGERQCFMSAAGRERQKSVMLENFACELAHH